MLFLSQLPFIEPFITRYIFYRCEWIYTFLLFYGFTRSKRPTVYRRNRRLIPSIIPINQNNLFLPISLPNGIDPVSVQFGGGDLQWFFENSFNEPIDITLKLPFADSLNNELFQTISLPAYNGTD